MKNALTLAVTADLHWAIRQQGDEATRLLADFLHARPPDVLILGGDVGHGRHFGDCLALFDRLDCRKALVPGNHDVWVEAEDARGDSLEVYRRRLPRVCAEHGFHYLDDGPLYLSDELAVVGCINWYDYSWALEKLRELFPGELGRLQTKRFTRGQHNDANYVRWPLDDVGFTREVVGRFAEHLQAALARAGRVVVVTHHPPYYELGFPRPAPPTSLDGLLWDAFCGNRGIEDLLARQAERIGFAFCGHTHRDRTSDWRGIAGYNIGGDYHYKRLLWVDTGSGAAEAHLFGNPTAWPG
jgi:predicted phosphohydrolase